MGIPGPFPLAIGNNFLSKLLVNLNQLGIRISKGLFSYQIFITAETLPSLAHLLANSVEQSKIRSNAFEDNQKKLTAQLESHQG